MTDAVPVNDPSQGPAPETGAEARSEALALARNWLLADPDLPFSRARRDAQRLKVPLTPRVFSEARRLLGITTAGPPRPSTKRGGPSGRTSKNMSDKEKAPTPMTAFVTEYLRAHPEADYGALKAAAAQKGFKIAPIVFGRARKELGMAPMAKRAPTRAKSEGRAPRAGGGGRRGGAGATFSGDLGDVLGRLQEMAAERDRFHSALEEIARVIRNVL
jgi:hypothetical protein